MEKSHMFEQAEATLDVTVTVTEEIGAGFGSIHAEKVTTEQAEANANEAATFLREVSVKSPTVCIDGRTRTESQIPFELGPHIAGGAMTLLVAAEAIKHQFQGAKMLEQAKQAGFDLRAHDDDTNRNAGHVNGTGCGANDKLPAIGVNFRQNKDAIAGVMQALMNEDFDEEVFAGLSLPLPFEENWDKDFLRLAVGENKVENLHDDGEGVHGHKEQMVIFNFVPNTTIDRDAYVTATGKQAFVVDMWFISELADRLADNDAQTKAMEHAMVAYQIATYLTLCDGSHRAVVIAEQA